MIFWRICIFLSMIFLKTEVVGQAQPDLVSMKLYYQADLKFLITIQSLPTKYSIVYKLSDSTSRRALEKDPDYKKMIEFAKTHFFSNPQNRDSILKFSKQVDSLKVMRTLVKADSLIIVKEQYPQYDQLVTEVVNAPNDSLNILRLGLDGYSVYFSIINKGVKREFIQWVPDNSTLLGRLLLATTALYREIKKNDFLNHKEMMRY